MKKNGLLHPQLAKVVASMGHGDMLVICDAGLPIPNGVERIDLAFDAGKPSFADVFEAVLKELQVEGVVLAKEIKESSESSVIHDSIRRSLSEDVSHVEYVAHSDFKTKTLLAKAVVRTGELTPYANVILSSGVTF